MYAVGWFVTGGVTVGCAVVGGAVDPHQFVVHLSPPSLVSHLGFAMVSRTRARRGGDAVARTSPSDGTRRRDDSTGGVHLVAP